MDRIWKRKHLGTSRKYQSRTYRRLRRTTTTQEPQSNRTEETNTMKQKIPLRKIEKERREACKNNDYNCRQLYRQAYIPQLARIFPISFHYITDTCLRSIFSISLNRFFLSTFHLLLTFLSNLFVNVQSCFS